MMNLDHSNAALFAALALAQSEVENATKNSVNGGFSKNGKPSYADLAEVLNTVRPVYSRHGIAIVQSTGFDGVMVSVTTALVHKEGGYVTSVASCTPAKTDGQGVGAATTYLRRYSLAAACGVAQEDDDGQSAAHNRPAVVAKPSNQLLDLLAATQDATDEDVLRNLYKATENLVEHEKGEARKAIVQKRSTITKV
jgi:ERF superfamily